MEKQWQYCLLCRSCGCFKRKGWHHTSFCDRNDYPVLTVYTPSAEETLPTIIPSKVNGTALCSYLDTGSGRNFISLRLKLTQYVLSATQKQSVSIFHLNVDSVDGQARERIEVSGAKMADFTTMRRPDLSALKMEIRSREWQTFP